MSEIEVRLLSSWGTDRTIAESAWVSTGIDGDNKSDLQVADLVKRLATAGHGVPFESVLFRFYIKCPRYIETQIIKHRIASINGLSARYRQVPESFYVPDDLALLSSYYDRMVNIMEQANNIYAAAMAEMRISVKEGFANQENLKRAKETFRGILPQAQMTELNVTINLRSLANFLRLRGEASAQKEIREIAKSMSQLIAPVAPVAVRELSELGWKI